MQNKRDVERLLKVIQDRIAEAQVVRVPNPTRQSKQNKAEQVENLREQERFLKNRLRRE